VTIDLDTARAIFEGSRDLTVGLEEEFAILDSGTLDMVPRFEELRDAAQADPVLAASIAGELISSEIEIRSGPGDDLADAIRRQRDHRRRLFSLALERGMALGATGTHPWADYREQRIIDTAHYRRVEEGLQYVAWRNNTFSLHVHVGLRDADRAVAVCDRLRPALPLLLAVSANSPYVDGRDSGLHTARTQTFTKSFPRCGVPDPFGTWAQFSDYVRMLERTNSIVEYTQVWWSIRPHVTFGTVEVRICDAQGTAQESEGLAALIVAAVAQAARDHDEGRPAPEFLGGPGDAPARLIEENMWRAIRFGLDGPMLDLGRLEEYPGVDVVPRLLEWSAPARAEHGIDPVLPERTGAQRQRRRIAAGATMDDVYAASVRETRETYAQEIPA
jgi:glutamate---cysteine ligase / carboxylate-amine ligase